MLLVDDDLVVDLRLLRLSEQDRVATLLHLGVAFAQAPFIHAGLVHKLSFEVRIVVVSCQCRWIHQFRLVGRVLLVSHMLHGSRGVHLFMRGLAPPMQFRALPFDLGSIQSGFVHRHVVVLAQTRNHFTCVSLIFGWLLADLRHFHLFLGWLWIDELLDLCVLGDVSSVHFVELIRPFTPSKRVGLVLG